MSIHPGPLMRVLVVTIAPIYWALAGESGDALNGHSLTGGSFQQESHVEFATGKGGAGGEVVSPEVGRVGLRSEPWASPLW